MKCSKHRASAPKNQAQDVVVLYYFYLFLLLPCYHQKSITGEWFCSFFFLYLVHGDNQSSFSPEIEFSGINWLVSKYISIMKRNLRIYLSLTFGKIKNVDPWRKDIIMMVSKIKINELKSTDR